MIVTAHRTIHLHPSEATLSEPTMVVTTATVRVPVTPAAVYLEIYEDRCRVWDEVTYTDCGTDYYFDAAAKPPALIAMEGGETLTDIPYFSAVFKAVSEQYALNRANPLGAFIKTAVEAMDRALAAKEGTCVYFAGCGGRVKIGWSSRVGSRLADLQTGNPEPIRLLGVLPGGRLKERQLHEKFADVRLSGEWFTLTPDLIAYISESVLA